MEVKVCKGCGVSLDIVDFSFERKLCWDCFIEKANFIVKNIKDVEDREILKFLLNVTTYTFTPREPKKKIHRRGHPNGIISWEEDEDE